MNINIPTEYKDYSEIELCSNKLSGVKYLFGIGNIPPIILGKGDHYPICWIFTQNAGIWQEIVTANKSHYLPLQVFAHEKKLLIQVYNKVILDSFENDRSTLIIQKLDFKPLGFNIEGDSNGLKVGGATISNNTIVGGKFFIGLG